MSVVDPARDRVVELRQYTLHPGRRDALMTLFARAFAAPQELVGARVLGTFLDADDPHRFVWLRGFDAMPARHAALSAFYDGPDWRAHRDAANATMRDSDNVLLLRPPTSLAAFGPRRFEACLVMIHALRSADPDAFALHYAEVGVPMLHELGAETTTLFVTETAPNTFDRLPVRTGESVLVCMAGFADLDALDHCLGRLRQSSALRDRAPDALLPAFMSRPEALRLVASGAAPPG